MKIKIYGYSDDIIMVDGDMDADFGCYDKEGVYVAFSDGTLLFVEYAYQGIWRITPHAIGLSSKYLKDECMPSLNDKEHTDVVHLEGDFKWILFVPKGEGEAVF